MWPLLILMTFHWIADFVLQNDWMALGKSKRLFPLTVHVWVYTMVMMIPMYLLGISGNVENIGKYLVIVGGGHFVTDFVTSRINSRLWAAGQTHYFFVSVGFDQLLHAWNLALALEVLNG